MRHAQHTRKIHGLTCSLQARHPLSSMRRSEGWQHWLWQLLQAAAGPCTRLQRCRQRQQGRSRPPPARVYRVYEHALCVCVRMWVGVSVYLHTCVCVCVRMRMRVVCAQVHMNTSAPAASARVHMRQHRCVNIWTHEHA